MWEIAHWQYRVRLWTMPRSSHENIRALDACLRAGITDLLKAFLVFLVFVAGGRIFLRKVYVVLYAILTNRRPVMDPVGKYVRYFGYQAAGATPPKTLAGAKALNQGECERDPVQCLRFKDQVPPHTHTLPRARPSLHTAARP